MYEIVYMIRAIGIIRNQRRRGIEMIGVLEQIPSASSNLMLLNRNDSVGNQRVDLRLAGAQLGEDSPYGLAFYRQGMVCATGAALIFMQRLPAGGFHPWEYPP